MARKRKTIQVSEILAMANRRLIEPDCRYSNPQYRRGIASLLEAILHETGNYEGFQFHEWESGGHAAWVASGKPKDTAPFIGDETRRRYYAGPGPRAPKEGATMGLEFPLALNRSGGT